MNSRLYVNFANAILISKQRTLKAHEKASKPVKMSDPLSKNVPKTFQFN